MLAISLEMTGFDAVFGNELMDTDNDGILDTPYDVVARNVVRAAADRWESVINDFNYDPWVPNDYFLHVQMDSHVTDFGGSTRTFPSPDTSGSPFTATVTLESGLDFTGGLGGAPDGNGDGFGYFLDPTPNDWSEFPSVVNAFVGNANVNAAAFQNMDINGNGIPDHLDDRDGDGDPDRFLYDFYSHVAHEIGHAMGFSSTPFVDFPNGFAEPTHLGDPDGSGALWKWRSSHVPGALLTDSNGDGQSTVPIHVATGVSFTGADGQSFAGVTELMNASYSKNQRQLISDLDVYILRDCFDYEVTNPVRWGNMHSSLDETTGLLTLRGGEGTSADKFELQSTLGYPLYTHVEIGDDVPGTLAWQMGEELWYDSNFETLDVNEIELTTGDGDDRVTYAVHEYYLPATINTETGDDVVHIDYVGPASWLEINTGIGADTVIIDEVALGATVVINTGDDADRVFIGHIASGANVEISTGSGDDVISFADRAFNIPTVPHLHMLGDVEIEMSAGVADDQNRMVFNRADEMEIDWRPSIAARPGRIDFAAGGNITLRNPGEISEIVVNAQSNDNEFTIHSIFPSKSLTINTELDSANLITMPNVSRCASSNFVFDGAGNDDRVIMTDPRNDVDPHYRVDTGYRGAYGPETFVWMTDVVDGVWDGMLEFQSVSEFTINGSDGDSTYTFYSSREVADWNINGGGGNDLLSITPTVTVFDYVTGEAVTTGGVLGSSLADINFDGGAGDNELVLDNRRAEPLDGLSYYHFADGTVRYNGTSFLSSTSVADITIRGSEFIDDFEIDDVPYGVALNVYGGGGEDEFTIGNGDLEEDLRGDIFLDGGSNDATERDLVKVFDNWDPDGVNDYAVMRDYFAKYRTFGFPPLDPIICSVSYAAVENIELTTKEQSSHVYIESFDGDIQVTAATGSTIDVGGDTVEQIHGRIELLGDDLVININDQNGTGDGPYDIYGVRVTKQQAGADLIVQGPYGDVDRITLNANTGANQIDVRVPLAETEINAGAGDDTIRVMPNEQYLGALIVPVQFNGQGGVDTLELFDNGFDTAIDYRIVGDSLIRNDSQTISLDLMEVAKLYATDGPNLFDIESTSPNKDYYLFGGGGSDTFEIGGGNFYEIVTSDVFIDGGTSEDTQDVLTIDDSEAIADGYEFLPQNYGLSTVTATTFGRHGSDIVIGPNGQPASVDYGLFSKFGTPPLEVRPVVSSTLGYMGLDRVLLHGSDASNEFHVDGTLADTTLELSGYDGNDVFLVDAAGLNSNVTIDGGTPSSPPGDSLQITGTPESVGMYTPNVMDTSSGLVTVDGHNVRFERLEPIAVEDFDSFTMVTPRSRDFIDVEAAGNGWSRISGVSGGFHPRNGLELRPFESLTFRDVREVTLDTAALDDMPYEDPDDPDLPPYIPLPLDDITVGAGALNADGLQTFIIKTGSGVNVVEDLSWDSNSPALAELVIDGNGGHTTYHSQGEATRLNINEVDANHWNATALNSEDEIVARLRFDAVSRASAPGMARNVSLVTSDVGPIGLGVREGRQLISAHGIDIELGVDPDSLLEWYASGQSRLELGELLVGDVSVVGNPLTRDDVTIAPLAAGPQPEPPIVPELRNFNSADVVTIESPTLDGNPLSTSFEAIIQPLEIAVELLVITTGDNYGLRIDNADTNEFPELVLSGIPSEGIGHEARIQLPFGEIDWEAVELLVRTAGIENVSIYGSDHPEMVIVTPESTPFGPIPPGPTNPEIEAVRTVAPDQGLQLRVIPDEFADRFNWVGGGDQDALVVEYPETDTHTFVTNATDVERLTLDAGIGAVEHRWTPSLGVADFGDWTVQHDGATTEATLVGTTAIDRLEGHFEDRISLDHQLTGSTSVILLENAQFDRGIATSIEGKNGADNKIILAEVNTIHDAESELVILGGSGGTDHVWIANAGADNRAGRSATIDLKDGDNTVVFTDVHPGQAFNAVDNVSITGGAGATNTLVYSADASAPWYQVNHLASDNPELTTAIGILQNVAESIETELTNAGTPLFVAPGASKAIQFVSDDTTTNLVAVNTTDRPAHVVLDTDGEVNTDVAGNVTVNLAAFAGTGIFPDEAFQTYAVTTTADSGPGSLRAAIDWANAVPGDDWAVITFAIPDTDTNFVDADDALTGGDTDADTFVIAPLTALPALTRGMTLINGQTQQLTTGDTNPFGPEIVVDGDEISVAACGLQLGSSHNWIHGLNLRNFSQHGLLITADANTVTGNYIGTDATGQIGLGNGYSGVSIYDAGPNNIIGGTTEAARNVIADNDNGIVITYGGGNVVQGNYIGTDATGTRNLGNPGRGVWLKNSPENLIGGNLPGSGNLISGDASHRGLIAIEYEHSTGNTIQGNYIGVDVTGSFELGTCITGIRVDWGAGHTLIGTDGDGAGDDLEGNLVAGIGGSSGSLAIRLNGDDNVVAGNLIGTNSSGTVAIPNYRGVGIWGSNNRIGTNGDGVSDQLERNIVDSIEVNGSTLEDGAQHNVIAGNYIGTDIIGIERLGSGGSAFSILFNYAHNNRIGTDADGVSDVLERNVIGSSHHAVQIANSTGNVVAGNFIGVGADGITPVSEAAVGGIGILIRSGASANRIGGATEVERNIISGNEWSGVMIGGLGCEENVVQGNYIGVDALGNPLGNHMHGVLLGGTATGTLIGGTHRGEGNVIANNGGNGIAVIGEASAGNAICGNSLFGNTGHGIFVDASDDNVIQGNYIGTDVTGTVAMGNRSGIWLQDASGTVIGGTEVGAGNLISGNDSNGIYATTATGTVIQGNLIGTDVTGSEAMGNGLRGIYLLNSPNNLIGGSESGNRNIIAANKNAGIVIEHEQSTGNRIQGNYVGTDVTGTIGLSNGLGGGVSVTYGAAHNTIGTDGDGIGDADEGNVISGQVGGVNYGVWISGGGENVVAGNLIGTDAAGESAIRNYIGIGIASGHNRIGTNGDGVSDELERNIVDTIQVNGANANGIVQHNIIAGNYVGTDITGKMKLGTGGGILVANGADNNRIGTDADSISDELERNVIAGTIEFRSVTGNVATGNLIGVGADGITDVSEAAYGVFMRMGAVANTIGGTSEAERNVISGQVWSGICLAGEGTVENVVQGNFIGVDAFGNPLGNGQSGVNLSDGASRNLIGGSEPGARNVISANNWNGISIANADENIIQGNFIGTDVTGTESLGNGGYGIRLFDAGNTLIGGTESGAGNVISGNAAGGILVDGNGSGFRTETFESAQAAALRGWSGFGNLDHRNLFGFSETNYTDVPLSTGFEAGGTFARSSSLLGETEITPRAYYADTGFGTQFSLDQPLYAHGELIVTATDAFDGGVRVAHFNQAAAEANQSRGILGLSVLEPNPREYVDGLRIKATISLDNGTFLYGRSENGSAINAPAGLDEGTTYLWCYVYDPTGGVYGQGRLTVEVYDGEVSLGTSWIDLTASQRAIGASLDAFGICGGGGVPKPNNPNTITIFVDNLTYSRDTGNTIQGNYIGTGADGVGELGNGGAGVAIVASSDNLIGGDTPAAGNVIAANHEGGVSITGAASIGNTVRGNSIRSNDALGIDLNGDGVTPNDNADPDDGPNRLQNFPVLTAAAAGEQTRVVGTLNSTPNATYTLDFYANADMDPTDFGEGERWLGAVHVTTDATGDTTFDLNLDAASVGGELITATATGPDGSTSEFSGAFMATGLSQSGDTLIVGGGAGDDTILLTEGSVAVTVNDNDVGHFDAEVPTVQVYGLAGNDKIISVVPNDTQVFAGPGDDSVQTGPGNDSVAGGDGDDDIRTGDGDDHIDGGGGNDTVDGQAGADTVVLGDGDDTVVSDASDDLGVYSFDILSPIPADENCAAVRGQAVQFLAVFPDPDSTVTWDFDDGGTDDQAATSHVYTEVGTYGAELTITDSAGNQTRFVRDLSIAVTAMQTDPHDAAGTVLAVGGTTNDDRILIAKHGNSGNVKVLLDGDSLGTFAPTSRLHVYGQAGDDNIESAGSVTIPSWFFGGAGDDRIKGGGGNDVLDGGPGDDQLNGGRGSDLMIGGPGADRLVGSQGEDILIGGALRFANQEKALAAIMAEWTSDHFYDERVANLHGDRKSSSFADRANGQVYLTVLGEDRTVVDDHARDTITGSAGRDWFFANLTEDKLTDLKREDVLSELESAL